MRPKLIILSDLWGIKKSNWVNIYTKRLNEKFDVKYYDCCELGEIDTSIYNQDILHNQFINGGIEIAASRLLELEKGKINILAFSIGGTIAWKAGVKGLKINNLYAISSTRLRYESKKPNCKINLIFGEKDNFKPNADWFKKTKVKFEIIKNEGHEIYQNPNNVLRVCEEIKKQYI